MLKVSHIISRAAGLKFGTTGTSFNNDLGISLISYMKIA